MVGRKKPYYSMDEVTGLRERERVRLSGFVGNDCWMVWVIRCDAFAFCVVFLRPVIRQAGWVQTTPPAYVVNDLYTFPSCSALDAERVIAGYS